MAKLLQAGQATVEEGAGEEGSNGSNNCNINGNGTFFDCDTEALINNPLPTPNHKAARCDGNIGTPSFAGEIPGINIGAGEGLGIIRFAFVNNNGDFNIPSNNNTIVETGRCLNVPIYYPSSEWKKTLQTWDNLCLGSPNTKKFGGNLPNLAAAVTQPPLRISWPVNATCCTHPSNFAGSAVWEENNSILQAADTLRELSANLRKQAQSSQIDLTNLGEKLGW